MPKITISNQGKKVVNFMHNERAEESVLTILHKNYIDWMHACGGKGKCTTCRFNTLEGIENLAEVTAAEKNFLNDGRILKEQRMACQAVPYGDIEIEVPEKCKLPGIKYTI